MLGLMKALLVEDSPEFAEICCRILAEEGFAVSVAAEGDRAVQLARTEDPAVVLLDVALPGLDGFEVCRRIREFSDAYIIMVSGRTSELDKVVGLSMGADDYVAKPFSVRELAARIKAMQRRPRGPQQPTRRSFDRLSVDSEAREVLLDGSPVELTKIEFDILDRLSSAPRRVFSRTQLLQQVWGGTWFGDDHMIDVHVGNLRRKLGESASTQRYVRTVRGVGYRFEPTPAA